MASKRGALVLVASWVGGAFVLSPSRTRWRRGGGALGMSTEEAATATSWSEEQWALYASQSGRWEGVWSTFDDQGIEQMSHTGVWDVQLVMEGASGDAATHKLEVPGPGGGPREIEVGTYRSGALGSQVCAGLGMCCGPSLLRSGLMSTELVLRHGASRLRVTCQHAPALPNEESDLVEPALLCYRCVVSRERCDASLGAPTREVETKRWGDDARPADGDDTHFWRGVNPWAWRRIWGGDAAIALPGKEELQRYLLDEVEPDDLWHEYMRTGEASYNLVLPGGIRVQAPQVVLPNDPAPFRVAWMPNNDELIRGEAVLLALEPTDDMAQYKPPRLVTFRADALVNKGTKPTDPTYVDPPEEYDDPKVWQAPRD